MSDNKPQMAPVKGGVVAYLSIDGAAKAVEFYQKAFGATVQKIAVDSPQLKEIILNNPKGMDLALVRYKDGRKIAIGSAEGPIGFYLNNVDTAYRRAMAAGAKSLSAPGGGKGIRVARVADPEGHEIELLHLD